MGIAHSASAQLCVGDCDGDGVVKINEIVLGVGIALGQQDISTCRAMAEGDSDQVQIQDLVAAVNNALTGCPVPTCTAPAGGRCVEINPGDGAQDALENALLSAQPNDVIFINAGTYDLTEQLSLVSVDHVTIAGQGKNRTVLSFKNEEMGGEGLQIDSSNDFTLQDIGLQDGPGDLVKIMGSDGVTIRDVRTEWTNGPATTNGSYGIYPTLCRNVLVEDSTAMGASDTGIYVGQSRDIVVRRNLVENNVSGIEIENSVDADVYENTTMSNTGGILIFDTPGPPAQGARRSRVFNNQIVANNTTNFAPSGNTVAVVPTGTGLMVLANDQVEAFGNSFSDNNTAQVLLISYATAIVAGEPASTNPNYDLYSEGVYIHDNTFQGGGQAPDPRVIALLKALNIDVTTIPNILYDGAFNTAEVDGSTGQLPTNLRTCVHQPGATILNLDLAHGFANVNNDISLVDCMQTPLPAVALNGTRHIVITPGAGAQDQLQTAMISAQPGDDILIPAGTYELTEQLALNTDHVVLRGEGSDKTILRFDGLASGGEALLVQANDFSLQDLAIEDSPGDQFKIVGADGVRVQGVRTEWTAGPQATNGAYGIYPVQCLDVLVENSVAKGASDTGIYVGQSRNVLIRSNDAELNVAGIEIENTTLAEVHDNTAEHNAGGILVFNLPGLQVFGSRTLVHDNTSADNNTQNFAPTGNIVAGVPTGTGLMVLANDQVEAYGNTFQDNNTVQVLLISYNTAQLLGGLAAAGDPNFDPYSESLFIHDNTYVGGGTMPPDNAAFQILVPLLGGLPLPQILYDGDVDPAKLQNGVLPDALRTCIEEAPATTFADLNVPTLSSAPNIVHDPSAFHCSLDPIPVVAIAGVE